jgi:3-methyl-2-oxobutanoate hydroxymethyltransferase
VPAGVAKAISQSSGIPTIGIGAGVDCDGQVLVIYDLLGISPGKSPRFVKNFLSESQSVDAAISAYRDAVKSKSFPTAEQSF